MASAGRILIMPKGDYNAETEYEMLDLVYHDSTSWLAKKNVVGIEPSEANAEYWHKLCEADLSSCLKISGGTLSGDLRIEKDKPRLQMKNLTTSRTLTIESGESGISSFGNYLSNSDQTNLQLRKSSEGLSELLRIAVDGQNSYRVFGEHNIPLLKTTIFKSKVVNGTTDSNGLLKPSDLTVSATDVIFCRVTTGTGICTQYNDNGNWAYRLENADRTPIANKSVSIKVVYLEIL